MGWTDASEGGATSASGELRAPLPRVRDVVLPAAAEEGPGARAAARRAAPRARDRRHLPAADRAREPLLPGGAAAPVRRVLLVRSHERGTAAQHRAAEGHAGDLSLRRVVAFCGRDAVERARRRGDAEAQLEPVPARVLDLYPLSRALVLLDTHGLGLVEPNGLPADMDFDGVAGVDLEQRLVARLRHAVELERREPGPALASEAFEERLPFLRDDLPHDHAMPAASSVPA